jgi:hypothetical protein
MVSLTPVSRLSMDAGGKGGPHEETIVENRHVTLLETGAAADSLGCAHPTANRGVDLGSAEMVLHDGRVGMGVGQHCAVDIDQSRPHAGGAEDIARPLLIPVGIVGDGVGGETSRHLQVGVYVLDEVISRSPVGSKPHQADQHQIGNGVVDEKAGGQSVRRPASPIHRRTCSRGHGP